MAQPKKTSSTSDAKKIKELEKTISDLNAMVQVLMKQGAVAPTAQAIADRDVTFISLCNHPLNLSTEPNGGGTVYTFNEFGEEQVIPYSEAKRIIRVNKEFIKGGKCYIADDELVSAEHLTNDYKKILNKDSLLELLSSDRNKFKEIFDKLTMTQKEIFRDIVVERLFKDKNSVDMNIVQYINETLKTNLLDGVDYGKDLLNNEN